MYISFSRENDYNKTKCGTERSIHTMKAGKAKRIAAIFAAAALIFSALAVFTAADDSIETVAKYGTAKAIDGILDEGWDGTEVNKNECTFMDRSGATDIAVNWRVMYDNVYLYFFVEVTDSTLGDKDFEFEAWGNYYQKNSIHMMFDMGYERETYYDENAFYIDVSCQGYFHGRGMGTSDTIKYAVVLTEKGYNVELRLDHTAFEDFKAQKGTAFGFDIWGNDCLAPFDGRLYCVTWADESDQAWKNASCMGTILLGEIPEGVTPTEKEIIVKERYPGIADDVVDSMLKGTELKSEGASYEPLTNLINPQGGGNKDIYVIVDGNPGKTDTEQYDSYMAEYTDDFDPWFGVGFGGQYIVTSVAFWEGGHWGNGGWFGAAPKIQLLKDGEWYDYDQTMAPEYPEDSVTAHQPTYEPYLFALSQPVLCEGVRVIGPENQFGQNTSCSEIEVFGYKADADVSHDTLDGKTPVTPEVEPPVSESESDVAPVSSAEDTQGGEDTVKTEKPGTKPEDTKKPDDTTKKTEPQKNGSFPWWIIAVAVVAIGIAVGIILATKKKK